MKKLISLFLRMMEVRNVNDQGTFLTAREPDPLFLKVTGGSGERSTNWRVEVKVCPLGRLV